MVGMTLQQAEAVLISATLQHTNGKLALAASILGIDRSTLYNKIKRYGIPRSGIPRSEMFQSDGTWT
jgi:transcriptional regulator of acetoin/glycerol metabolism